MLVEWTGYEWLGAAEEYEAYEEDDEDDDDDDDGEGVGDEVEVDEEVLGGGVYSGQSVLVGSHCVIVTVAVIYSVLVVVCATADKALAARTTNDEACILKGVRAQVRLSLRFMVVTGFLAQ